MRTFLNTWFVVLLAAGSTFATPDTLPGLALWLDADDAATVLTNATGSVTNWMDKSGFDRHADNFEGTPDLATNVLNGKAVINFQGAAFLYTTHDFRSSLTAHTIFTVAHYLPGLKRRVISSRGQNWLFGYHGALDERWYANGWIHQMGTANEDWHLHAGTITSDADPKATFYKDGAALVVDGTGSSNTAYVPAQLSLGAFQNQGNEQSDCEIAEVIIYDRVLSEQELDEVGFYLQSKYGFDFGYNDPDGPLIAVEDFGQLMQASNITETAADLTGNLLSTGQAAAVVTTFYGTSDGGSDPLAWDAQQLVPGNPPEGLFNVSLSGLQVGTVVQFRFMAVSAGATNFSELGVFHTPRNTFPFPIVSNGLKIWLDAGAQTYADGDSAPIWLGQSTNSLSGVQDLRTAIPTFVSDGINGQPALRFDGGDVLLMDDFSAEFSNAATLFVVGRAALAANYTLFSTRPNADAWREGTWSRPGTFRTNRINLNDNAAPYEDPTIYEIVSGTSAWELFYNGELAASDVPQFNAGIGEQKAIGGRTQDSNLRLNGEIAEILIYDRELTMTERQDIGFYLEQKYGLRTAYANPNFPVVNSDAGASDITSSTATLNGELETDGLNPPTDLTVYWGATDASTNTGSWAQSQNLGVQAAGALAFPVTSLLSDTTYYYRFYGENGDGDAWSERSGRFHTDLVPANFAQRLELAFCGYEGSEVLTNFTTLVVLSNHIEGLDFADVAVDGADLRFTDEGGVNVLPHEIEQWDPTGGVAHIWVQVPELTAATRIRAYWGNPSAGLPVYTSNGAAWDDAYAGVWHMTEPAAQDSTFPENDGVAVGAVNTTTGRVGFAQSMNNSYIDIVNGEHDFDFVGDQMTASAWVRIDGGWRDGWQAFVSKRGEGQGWQIRRINNTEGISFTLRGTAGVDDLPGMVTISDGEWHYLVASYGKNRRTLYIDGVPDQDGFDSGFIVPTTVNNTIKIGADDGGASRHRGLLDEVRVSNNRRSDDWVLAEYQNMAANTNFICYGQVQASDAPEITNGDGVGNLSPTTADLQGELISDGGAATSVSVYYGTTDGGADTNDWDAVMNVGVLSPGPFVANVTGLSADTDYYYRAYASNANGDAFAFNTVFFRTAGPPQVSNGAGATNIEEVSAVLNGAFLNLNRGDVTIYYGPVDGAEVSGNWAHSLSLGTVTSETFSVTVNDAFHGQPYYYRVFASNAQGADWSDASVQFSTDAPFQLSGEGLTVYQYDTIASANNLVPLSVLASMPEDGTIVYAGQISHATATFVTTYPSITDVLNFSLRYEGYFVPDVAGVHTFGLDSDDRSVLFIDLDGDGVFDNGVTPDPGELIIDRPCCGNAAGQVVLEARPYKIAMGYQQGGGGARLNVRWKAGAFDLYGDLDPLDTRSGHFFPTREPVNALVNTAATDVDASTATLHADLNATGSVFEVIAYWGTSDEGTNAVSWGDSGFVGTLSNGVFDVAYPVAGLSGDTAYFYTFRATNAVDDLWAPASSAFSTIALPTIENGPSAPIAGKDGVLLDTVLSGGSAQVRVYYGTTDGGTDTNAWEASFAAGEFLEGAFKIDFTEGYYGLNYFYRLYAENPLGSDWASTSVPFTLLPPTNLADEGLELRQWNNLNGSGFFNPMSAMQARTDYDGIEIQTRDLSYDVDFDTALQFIDDNNTFMLLWQGVMYPPFGAGTYSFALRHDDQSVIVIDLDGDGDFDDGATFDPGELVVDGGLLNGSGCCTPQYGTVLLEDRPYRMAITLTQGAGGNYIDAKWTFGVNTNDMSTMTFIDGQSGIFFQDLDDPAYYIRPIPPVAVTANSADLRGDFSATGSVFNLTLYYGDNDGGTNAGDWDVTVPLGSYTDVVQQISYPAAGLDTSITNYYTFRIDNALETRWATNSIAYIAGSDLDSDGDGMTDSDEVIAGTNPNDPSSFLGLRIARGTSENERNLSFDSVSGRNYRIERRDSLLSGTWTTVQSALVGNDGVIAISDTQATAYSIYRIVIE